ncbi:hypothetical protein [Paraburkholderia hospita]|jgi:hypothetical protein|uniref:Uncharacterized protein n=1 Tax=Paraburkholderia hospita TaxID=169430 RepID=A0AAJ4VT80_9BURK|nr:hypothetical protein [Paraburkholderia hospita]EUC12307.1 hypothetical protein PMI06_008690 [Burkholderia sp. BT03]SKD05063.1 hypothetical protein SAMN05445504_9375 [Burkholderia sp. CF099]AUT76453.1 hypothetical protein C2L64_50495 [Paraburkholderia hospita]AXF06061.1 hypothetical protein CUJ88_48035 [Paraburkholderia hospita]SEI20214.1 hypothetical protein SAMN05192544_103682 [Paraburkholderia hospita]
MSHALKPKPQLDATAGTRKGMRLSLASIPALTKDGRAKPRAAAGNPGNLPELPEWRKAGSR